MTQVVTVDEKIIKNILATLQELKTEVVSLREKVEQEPPYGSKAWWEWSDKKAQEDIKAGRYTVVRNKKELHQFLDSLKAQ